MHARVRFQSTLTATATNSINRESPSEESNSVHLREIQPPPQLGIGGPIQAEPSKKKPKKPRIPRTKSGKGIQNNEDNLSILSTPAGCAISTSSSTATVANPQSYQSPASVFDRKGFPELEPAPFPRNIHSYKPVIIREPQKKFIAKRDTYGAHNDLESFKELHHNTKSTIYRGTLFEYQTQNILRKCLGIYTQRFAGNGDCGVDLRGTWFLPTSTSSKPGDMVRHLKVIVQCKWSNSKIGPKYVRELQGSLSYETQPTMAILAISSDFTRLALSPYASSLWPMALVVIDAEKQQCSKLMWNRAAERVMHGVQLGTRWSCNTDGKLESQPVLCFDGVPIERVPGPHLIDRELDDDGDMDMSLFSSMEYILPDWFIDTEPEYLYDAPDATGYWYGIGEEEEDVDLMPFLLEPSPRYLISPTQEPFYMSQ
ncbi:hypothetical protein BGX21_007236 [Mortierella sp. AD011]|nr:hypothetical protein BGX21_007236 [Mortierella sp. AD011]